MMKPTMTLHEVANEMRAAGISCSCEGIASAIEQGIYPFGRIKKRGPGGYRSFEIFAVDFRKWLKERTEEA